MIRARGLTRRVAALTLVDRADLEIDRGQSVALAGARGAGRTTLLRLIGILVRPSAGELKLAGVDAIAAPLAARAHVIYAAGTAAGGTGLSVAEQLAFVAAARGINRSDALRAIQGAVETTRLTADARLDDLSAALRRRLALATALVIHPPIVLLDEPWTAGDREGRSVAIDCLAAFRQQGTTVVAALDEQDAVHDDVHRLFDSVIEMDRGRLTSVATLSEPAAAGRDWTLSAEAR